MFQSIEEMRYSLHYEGCRRCSLGFQKDINGCCMYRGNHLSKYMIVGEAPGKTEDSLHSPFTGPAGKLLDRIWAAIGWDTNKDWYLTNVVKCRPIAPKGIGKENLTPLGEQQKQCRSYLDREIELIQPRIVVLVGKVAVQNILPDLKGISMQNLRGQVYERHRRIYFPIWHPAYLLHNQSESQKYQELRLQMWEDIKKLKELVDYRNL